MTLASNGSHDSVTPDFDLMSGEVLVETSSALSQSTQVHYYAAGRLHNPTRMQIARDPITKRTKLKVHIFKAIKNGCAVNRLIGPVKQCDGTTAHSEPAE